MSYLRRTRASDPDNWRRKSCTCPAGILRFETMHPLRMGWFCSACLMTTLRTDAEIDAFLNDHEQDEWLRQAVLKSLFLMAEENRLEQVPARQMDVLPFD